MLRIGISGWNSKYNVGDDAMTAVLLRHLQTISPEADVAIYSLPDGLAYLADQTASFNYYGVKSTQPQPGFMGKVVHKLTSANTWRGLLQDRDIYWHGGGSVYQFAPVINEQIKRLAIARKVNPKIKMISGGVSIGPFKDIAAENAAKAWFKQSSGVVVRDQASFDILHSLDLDVPMAVAPDMALYMPIICPAIQGNKTIPRIGVSLRANRTSPEILAATAQKCIAFLEANPTGLVSYFQLCSLPKDDDLVYLEAWKQLFPAQLQSKIVPVLYDKNPINFYRQIADCRLMLCVRLHAAVLSYATKTPFQMFSYHEKCKDFCKMVGAETALQIDNPIDTAIDASLFNQHRQMLEASKGHFQFIGSW
jgi:polysaccharide pyruvyl transferase WcaK-like protein